MTTPRGSHLQGTLKNNLNPNILNTKQPTGYESDLIANHHFITTIGTCMM